MHLPATSILEQYRISDFLEWHERGQLKLNPFFQRRSVWTGPAKVYLIDTILRRLPIPKLYIRTQIDAATRSSFREVVDGQQRLRAIIEFASDEWALTPRAKELRGLRYSTMGEELQEAFLTYPIAVDQLVNASDSDVLEVFARLNSYTASLSPAEKRHAKYQGSFKWAVHEAARDWSALWDTFKIVSVQERLRMADDSLSGEMFGVLLQGVSDGGAAKIDALYKAYDDAFPTEDLTRDQADEVVAYILAHFHSLLANTPLNRAPQFLMLFAAVAHALVGIPPGQIGPTMPARSPDALSDLDSARAKLSLLISSLEMDSPPPSLKGFVEASLGSTQRIATRRVRFLAYYNCLLP
jgi:hypothetical protein